MDFLIEQAAETDGVQSNAPLLGPDVWSDVKLAGGVAVDMTIETGDTQAGTCALAVVGGVEFFLRKRCEKQEPESVDLVWQ